MTQTPRHDIRTHDEISALIPWYVNGTGSESERRRVAEHVALCAVCREDLALEQALYHGMNIESSVEYMPAASLKRLQARIDGAAPEDASRMGSEAPVGGQPGRRSVPWLAMMAASVAVMAVAIGLWTADRWIESRAAPNYHTVTAPARHLPDEVIRAVFAPTITLVELQAVLDEAGLRIISGPSEAGVYSLAADSSRPVSDSLAALRAHANVRFAESIQSAGPRDTP